MALTMGIRNGDFKEKKNGIHVRAIFRGKDGSCGYSTDKEYALFIKKSPQSNNIHIERLQYGEGKCEYETIVSFLENWDNIRNI